MNSPSSGNPGIKEFLFARPLPAIAWVFIIMAIVALVVVLYRRERGLTPALRVSLIAMRIVVLLLVAGALFEPTIAVKETREEKRSLAVLVDKSHSMAVSDQRKRPEDIEEAAVALGLIPLERDGEPDARGSTLDTKQRNAIAAASRLDLARGLVSMSAAPLLESLREDLDIRYYAFGESVQMR